VGAFPDGNSALMLVAGTIYADFLPDREDAVRTALSTLYTAPTVSTR